MREATVCPRGEGVTKKIHGSERGYGISKVVNFPRTKICLEEN